MAQQSGRIANVLCCPFSDGDPNLERNAVQAIHDAVQKPSAGIERRAVQALAEPLREMKQSAGFVRQSLKEVSWLTIGLMLSAGLAVGLLLGYWPIRSSQNNMQEQLNRIGQSLAAQEPSAPAATAPDPHASAHKEKRSKAREYRPSPSQAMDLTRKRLERGKGPRLTKPQPRRR